ncbi:MAG: fibronectin type III domain-containing protein [Oscillospiraceae bacterium]|nr:fibronectin type III domain-containing protein [Oscillospiraceae bacterium]
MKLTNLFLAGITAAVTAAFATTGAASADGSLETARVSVLNLASTNGVNVTAHTQSEIQNYIAAHPFSTNDVSVFTREPDFTSPYTDPGALSSDTLQGGLNALNVMRYIAGIPEVTLNSEYNDLCQHGAYINFLNKSISHSPAKPSGVSDSLYAKGAKACGSSNLMMGYTNPAKSVLAYMNDSDNSNIDRLGHRRWCLNPSMKQTGFGQVNYYGAMYAFDSSYGDTPYSGVCWPAQNMPVDYFSANHAWSYSLGSSIADPNSVKVTLTRKSDNMIWNFSYNGADGYFNVENSGYGKPGCVIFRPTGVTEYKSGDVYTVHISGVGKTVDYTVNFFSGTAASVSENPVAVTGLKASPSTNSVTLSWNKNAAADSYQIDMYKDGKWTYVVRTTGTSYNVTGLTAGTSYEFRVFAFKGTNYSSQTKITASTTAVASSKPSAVTGLKASPSTNSVSLSWNKNANADSYQIDMYKNGKWTYVAKITGTSYNVTGLTAGTSYEFRVFAFKGTSYSAQTKITAATTAAASSKPSAVTGLKASPSTNSVSLSWNKNANADSYQIDMYKNGKWTYVAKITGTTYNITGLAANTNYQFRVFAFKGSSYSTQTKITVSTTAAASSKPAAVTGLNATPHSDSIRLSWNKNANADSYQIDMYKNGKWTYVTKITGTSYNVTGLAANTNYQFRVFAFKGSSYSTQTKITATTTAAASSKPAAVTGLKATPSANSVTLSWNKSATADSYQIDMYKNGKWTYVAKITGTSYNVTGLTTGTEYQFRVFAFKGSSYSNQMKVIATTKPTAVTGLSAVPGSNNVRLTWSKNSTADSYQVDMYKNGRWTYLAKTTNNSYIVTGLSSGYIYNFRVYAFKGSSYSSATNITAITR